MERFMNNLEDISGKLQDLGRKAIDEIGDALEELPETAKAEWAEAKTAWDERIKPAAEAHFDRLTDALGFDNDGKADDDAPAPETPETPQDEMERQVEAQVQQIRAASFQPNIISEYISGKYGKKDDQ